MAPIAKPDRRAFLQSSALTAGTLTGALTGASLARTAHAAGDDLLKVGLIGCGGRGSMAAIQALTADKNVKLWAMADVFEDRLQGSLSGIQRKETVAAKVDVPVERRFVGFDAYIQVIECCDVVLLCTPPGFRPLHLKAAVEAGKHVFAEKPVAVDAPGVRSVIASCEAAKPRNLSVVSGLCLRYDYGFQETIRRIHDGAIGKLHTLFANDYRGPLWVHPRRPEWNDMTYQMRNWYYYTWLSGDFNVEQHVHFLDVCAWAKGSEYPVRAIGMGGRQQRIGPEYGHIFDHFSIVYEYADGARLLSNTRQQAGCVTDLSAMAIGSEGQAEFREKKKGLTIKNATGTWAYEGQEADMYQTEHDELFASIRNGKPLNNGDYMVKSTLLAIMGRMAAYTGQAITWSMALNSQEDLSPPKYDWDVPLAEPPVARPGVTKFI